MSIIGNIFFNSLDYHSTSGNLLIGISDHLSQFLILEGFVKKRSLPDIDQYKKDLILILMKENLKNQLSLID